MMPDDSQRLCSNPTCRAPKGPCREGEPVPSECTFWEGGGDSGASNVAAAMRDYVQWSGRGMGFRDIGAASARAPVDLIGVVGAYDAGKTTLLTSLYLHIQRGENPPRRLFAGSLTLGGWEERAHFLRWPPAGHDDAMFPPHTSSSITREAALLHLALRGPGSGLREVLVTDAPGEWFTEWATSLESPKSQGARWIAERAAGFILVLDSEALAGKSKTIGIGRAREQSLSLIDRLGNEAGSRPVAAIWSKADVLPDVAEPVRTAIGEALSRSLSGPTETFATSVYNVPPTSHPVSMISPSAIVGWLLDEISTPPRVEDPVRQRRATPEAPYDPFLAFSDPIGL